MNPNSEGTRAINQDEHNEDAHAKRVVIRAQDPDSGDFVNIGATDNGDGSFSLKTSGGSGGGLTDAELRATPVDVNTELPAAAALADNTATPTAPAVGSFGLLYDGSTWDLMRNVAAAGDSTTGMLAQGNYLLDRNAGTWARQSTVFSGQNSSGTGIAASGMVGHFDDASTNTVTENNFAPVRINSSRALLVDGSAVTQPVSGTVTAAAQPGVDIGDVTINNSTGASAVNIQDGGNSITVDGTVSSGASATATGTSVARFTALTNTAQAIKASAGNLYGYHLSNKLNPAQDLYVHFYNVAAASVTVGTTTPSRSFFLPGGAVIDTPYSVPMAFGTAISVACSTTATGGTAPTNAIYVHAEYL